MIKCKQFYSAIHVDCDGKDRSSYKSGPYVCSSQNRFTSYSQTKNELENIIKAWIERERRYYARIIQNALGIDRMRALSERQKNLLDRYLGELLRRNDITEVSDAEIVGRYELITQYVSPISQEVAVEDFKRRQKMN